MSELSASATSVPASGLSKPLAQVHVAAAAIVGRDGCILIARRPEHLHQGGLWEFPGGKVEAGETSAQALSRELHEELGIRPTASTPLIRIPFDYPDKRVVLDVWRVSAYDGEPRGREGQPLRWVPLDQLDDLPFPAANRRIITALQLPDAYMITGDFHRQDDFIARLRQALQAGVKLVQLRAKSLPPDEFIALAKAASTHCRQAGAKLVLNGSPRSLPAAIADGIHLDSRTLMASNDEQLLPWRTGLIGASCHSPQELAAATRLDLDYVSLSPVCHTQTHPDTAAIGWEVFRDWTQDTPLPVYALGGMTAEQRSVAIQHGGQGIATIRGYWPE